MAKSEPNRLSLIEDPCAYEQKTSWAVGRCDPWSQVIRHLAQDAGLTERDLGNWGRVCVNVPNGDLFPGQPPNAIVEAPTGYQNGYMFVYRNTVPQNDAYLNLIYPHLQMVKMAGCITCSSRPLEAMEAFEWLIDVCPQVSAFSPERDQRIALACEPYASAPNLLGCNGF